MKATIIIAILAVVAVTSNSSVIKSSTRSNLIVGNVNSRDIVLYSGVYSRGAIANSVQYQDVVYRGRPTNRISSVQAIEVGVTQFANATIIAGGIGGNNVTVRFTSARGRGYYYQLNIYGR